MHLNNLFFLSWQYPKNVCLILSKKCSFFLNEIFTSTIYEWYIHFFIDFHPLVICHPVHRHFRYGWTFDLIIWVFLIYFDFRICIYSVHIIILFVLFHHIYCRVYDYNFSLSMLITKHSSIIKVCGRGGRQSMKSLCSMTEYCCQSLPPLYGWSIADTT